MSKKASFISRQGNCEILHKVVRNGNSKKCMEMLVQIIKEDLKLMLDQIVSISIHDSKTHHGDLEAVIFYRSQSLVANSEPCDSIFYQLLEKDEDTNWDTVLDELLYSINQQGQKTVSIGHTFRNVGEEKIACCFKIEGKQQKVFQHVIKSQRNSWDKMFNEAKNFMNKFILPHEFVALSFFEEEHPLLERENQNAQRSLIVYHTAGEKFQAIATLKEDIIGDIYSFFKFEQVEQKNWDIIYNQILSKMEEIGDEKGHYVATGVTSDNKCQGYQTAVLIKYDSTMAETLKDLRQGGCCGIF